MMTKAFLGGYFAEFEDVYHTEEDCPAGRLIPAGLRSDGTRGDRIWCPSCRAWEDARRARMKLAVPP
jgi:hypothetical protein